VITNQSGTLILQDGTVLHYSKVLNMQATGFTSDGESGNEYTALGTRTRYGVCAVDPRVIPLKTNLYVVSAGGSWDYGYARAEDVGGAVKGYIIDLFFPSASTMNSFGRRACTVYVLD